jgi:hypothetical protein
MDRLTKRYLITGVIGIVAMLTALGLVLFKASEKVNRADSAVRPTPSASASATNRR